MFVESNGHLDARRPPEKQYDGQKTKEAGGRQIAVDGSDYDPDPMLGEIVYGVATLTVKIMAKVCRFYPSAIRIAKKS